MGCSRKLAHLWHNNSTVEWEVLLLTVDFNLSCQPEVKRIKKNKKNKKMNTGSQSFMPSPVLSVQKVFVGCGRAGRLCLMGKYVGHRLAARPEADNKF